MNNRARTALCALLILILSACGSAATPFPELPNTPFRPTRVPVEPTTDPNAKVGNAEATASEPTTVAVQPTATATRVRPTLTPTMTLIAASATPAPPTNTPLPTATAVPDAKNGEMIFNNPINGDASIEVCASCHIVVPASPEDQAKVVGPSMVANGVDSGEPISVRAGKRVPGESPVEYLRRSILAPNEYLVPNSKIPGKAPFSIGDQSLMYQTYAAVLSDTQVNDLIAYLLTIR